MAARQPTRMIRLEGVGQLDAGQYIHTHLQVNALDLYRLLARFASLGVLVKSPRLGEWHKAAAVLL